jgi:hypothetical protein
MAYNLGGIVRLTYTVKDDTGALTNPSAATLTITQPDGTLAAGIVVDITPTVTGQLVHDFAPTQAGLHSVRWSTTGPTTAEDDTFVAEAAGGMLVSVDEAIAHLRATTTITSAPDREQVQWLCLVATDAIERDLDRILVRRAVTEVHNGSQHAIILRHTPVISVTSVTESGVLVDPSGYLLDPATGFLYRGTTSYANRFAWGYQNISVTYVAGYANPPRVARLAALNLVQSLYQQSQTAFHPGIDESSTEAFVSAALPGLSQIPGYNSLRSMAVA